MLKEAHLIESEVKRENQHCLTQVTFILSNLARIYMLNQNTLEILCLAWNMKVR